MPQKKKRSAKKTAIKKKNNDSKAIQDLELIASRGDNNKGSKAPKIESVVDLPGIGPTTAKKLQETGFGTLESLATVSIGELIAVSSLGERTAAKIIQAARDALNYGFTTADEVLDKRRNLLRITTGSNSLDDLFLGGIETGSITEFYGEYRTGKTQIAHQLCVTAQLPREMGGITIDGKEPVKVVYVDSEGTFRPERIVSIAQRYVNALDTKQVLKNILHGRAYNSDHQMVLAEKAIIEAQSQRIGLLIIDSLISHFRAEYVGRGTLAGRQQKLNQHIHTLLKAAEISRMAVIVTNQVLSKPDMFFGDPTAPVGGHIIAHASHTRVYLRKSKGERRIARIVDSPLLPENEAVFAIVEEGISDV